MICIIICRLLDRVSMGDVKSYNVPPAAIERVMTIAIILSTIPSKAGTWDISWPRAKRTISCADRFVMDLLQVKPEQVSEEQMEAVRPYLLDANKFTPVIHEVCEVLGIVWDWIVWLFDYIEVYRKQIVPFEEEKEELEQVLHLANQKLILTYSRHHESTKTLHCSQTSLRLYRRASLCCRPRSKSALSDTTMPSL
jgi:hypothetical protein